PRATPLCVAVHIAPGLRARSVIYARSLHDALPILKNLARSLANALPRRFDAKRQAECLIVANPRTQDGLPSGVRGHPKAGHPGLDRKSTRLKSSHQIISNAAIGMKKKPRSECSSPS